MASGMEDSKHDDGIGPEDEEDPIRETSRQDTPHFGPAAHARILARVGNNPLHCRIDFSEEFLSQARVLVLTPHRGIGDVHFRLDANDEPVGHGCSLAWILALTCSHGLPASGLF